MSLLHAQARALAQAGIKVFPCTENGKLPAISRDNGGEGYKDATDDLAQIDAWWERNPDFNIGVCPEDAGWCVIDLDPPAGEVSWIALLAEHGQHEPTYEVETPRGGRHLYFTGSLPPSASKLGPKIDTRGVGSYVLVPPSIVNGKPYRVVNDRELATVPLWIAPRLAEHNQRAKASYAELDTGGNIARARTLLRDYAGREHVAVEGCGGDNRTFQVACEVLNLGVSIEVAHRLLLEHWNPHCRPPWDDDELLVKVENADKYAQNEAGAWGVSDPLAAFGKTEAFRQALKDNQPRQSRYRLMSAADFDSEPEPQWIVPGLVQEDCVMIWQGQSQSFKSFLLLDVLLSVSAGRETFGSPTEPGLVLYGAIEDLRNIGKARRRAWQVAHGLDEDPLDNFRACLVPFLGMPGDFDEWREQIRGWLAGRKLKLLAIDTAGKALGGLSSNDDSAVRIFWKMCDDLREEFGCTVIGVHHLGKDPSRGGKGASNWRDDFDSVIETERVKEGLAVEVIARKHKNAQDGQRWTFKGRDIAGSLIFEPTSSDDHRRLVQDLDEYSGVNVGRAIKKREACSLRTALSTAELAQTMFGQAALGNEKIVRTLEKLGKTTLKAYCDDTGDMLVWWVPEREQKDA